MVKIINQSDNFPIYTLNHYDDYKIKISKITKKYRKKYKALKYNIKMYDNNFIKYNDKVKRLITSCLKELIIVFPELKANSLCIFLHGSLSRNTNYPLSDIDITFLYDNSLRNILIPIEESIVIALMKCFNIKKRSKLHPIMNNFENLAVIKESKLSNLVFRFGKRKIVYDDSMYKFDSVYYAINTSRDIKDLMQIYQNKIDTIQASEFCYSSEIIYCNDDSLDYFKNLNNLEKAKIHTVKNSDLIKMCDDIIEKISSIDINLPQIFSIADFKNYIKNLPNLYFYNLLIILRRCLNKDFNYNQGININILDNEKISNLFSKKDKNKLKHFFYLKNWFLTKTQLSLLNKDIQLSHVNTQKISKETIENYYTEFNKSPFNEVIECLKKYYDCLLQICKSVKNNL